MSGAELPVELDRLAREFVDRERKGECPTISEYVRRYPQYEDGIREIFPMLAVMEGVKPPSGSGARRPSSLDPSVRRLGDYRLLRVVGRGGMGVVYEAEQDTLGRRVALKVLPPQATVDPRFVERFRIEAQAAARLQHPNIVPVIGLGEDDGVHYYAMQFIDGAGLDQVLEETSALLHGSSPDASSPASGTAMRLFAAELAEGSSVAGPDASGEAPEPASSPLAVDPASRIGRRRYRRNVARIGLQAAEALAFAHARGVLHRDIKPSNIMLDAGGRAWITDFGLCRLEESDGLTRTGDLVGTLRYMAPECFSGVHDVRADVYGLGLTLYELLGAAPAFEDANRAELIRKVTQEVPPRLRSRDPTIPEDLATIVHKAIARDPQMRYQTADALVADLRAYLEGRPIAARAPSLAYVLRAAIRRHRPLAATILASLVLLVAGTVFYVLSVKDKEAQARLEQYVANVAAAEIAVRDGDLPGARRFLERAPPAHRGWEWRFLASRIDQSVRSFKSISPSAVTAVAHSRDGRWVAVGSHHAIHVYDLETGQEVKRIPGGAEELAWSPSGDRIATTLYTEFAVYAWPEGKRLTRRGSTEWMHGTCFDPTGAWLYYGSEDCQVHVLDAVTYRELATVTMPSKVRSIAIDASGKHLAVGRLDGKLSLVDVEDLSIRWTQQACSRGLVGVDFTGDGYVAATAIDGAVHVFRVADGSLLRVLPHEDRVYNVAGMWRAPLLATVDRSGRVSLWNVETGLRPEAWKHGRVCRAVSFQPDGRRVVSGSFSGTLREWSTDVTPERLRLGSEVDGVLCVATQPGGSLIASGEAGGLLRLWDLETSELVRAWSQHKGWVHTVVFSPDGTHVVSGDGARVPLIVVRRLSDDRIVHRLRGHKAPLRGLAYTPDGTTLLSVGEDGALYAWDAATGERRKRLQVSKHPLYAIAVSPTGLVAVGGRAHDIKLVDTSRWTVHTRLEGHEGDVRGLAFHPDGRVLASASSDQTVRLWDVYEAEPLGTLAEPDPERGPHTDLTQSVAFHPGGTRLATASRDTRVVLWDWERAIKLSTVHRHTSWVSGVAFTSSGDALVSSGSDRTVRVAGTRSAAACVEPMRRARERRDRAAPLVDRLEAELGAIERVIDALGRRSDLAAEEREAAMRLAHARRDTRDGLKRWAWRILGRADAKREAQLRVLTLGDGLLRHADLRALHDPEAYVIVGAAKHRLGLQPVRGYMDRALTMDPPRPELHAIAMAFNSLSFTREGNLKKAGYWLVRLKSHIALHPDAKTDTVTALHDEAWAIYRQKRKG